MTSTKCNIPALSKDVAYDTWRREISLWQRVTELAKKKQAMAVALSLSGKYREVATSISIDDLDSDNGMTELLKVMDENF